MSVKKNLIKNGIASALQKGVKVSEQLLLVPFFISAWGAAYYGEWLTLTIIPTMLGFSDLGFGSAACNSYVLKYAAGDKRGAANTAKSGFAALHIMVVSIVLLSMLVLFLLNYFRVFDKSLIQRNDAILAVFMLMLARTISFYSPLNEAFFRSARRVAYSINLQTIYAAANVVGGLIVLFLKGGIVVFAAVNMTISIVFNSIYALIAHGLLDKEDFNGFVDRNEIKSIFQKGLGFLLSPIWQAIFFQGTTFVVRLTLGPVAVTVFNTVRTLTRSVNQANSMVISSVIPEIQYELAAGNNRQSKKIFDRSLYIIIIIALIGMLFLYFFGPWFYQIWTHKALNPPVKMWNIFIVSILFNAIWWLHSDFLMAINRPYDITLFAVIISLISVLLTYILAQLIGLTGSSIGFLSFDVSLMIICIVKVRRVLSEKFK